MSSSLSYETNCYFIYFVTYNTIHQRIKVIKNKVIRVFSLAKSTERYFKRFIKINLNIT